MPQHPGSASPPSLSARPATGGRSDAVPSGAPAEGSASPIADAADEHDVHGANDRGAARARLPRDPPGENLAHRANPVAAMRDVYAFAVRAGDATRARDFPHTLS